MAKYTPMIQQYLAVKADYQDAFLFFRLGDFYEMFFQDAIKASQELEITLTSRDGGADEKIPMCGVPHHAAKNYIDQLVEKGYKVAICEQVEDPKSAKGVVKREVVQLITPGTMMEGKNFSEKENNYIASITSFSDQTYGLSFFDLSTGEGRVTWIQHSFDELMNELYSIGAKEIVVANDFNDDFIKMLTSRMQIVVSYEDDTMIPDSFHYMIRNIDQNQLVETVGRLIQYLQKTQKRSLEHIQEVQVYQVNQFMKIDLYSKRNLELTETIRTKGKKGSLLWLLDQTMTAMGGRMLKAWIDRPLIDKTKITNRLNMVETFMNHFFERQELRELLRQVYDLERLAGRVAFGNVNARDLIQLKNSLHQIPEIEAVIERLDNREVKDLFQMDKCESLTVLIDRSIKENPPLSIKEGDIIKDGFDDRLDKYRDASKNGKTWIAELERFERERTGIKSLKVGYNRVFGYYIEVTKANLHLLLDGEYERKQTLTNAERFITPELKEKEALILEAEEKIVELEYDLFTGIRDEVKGYIPRLQALASAISEIDVLQCFATISDERHYAKPQFSMTQLVIKDGRHPVVEKVMDSLEYVPNDCLMEEGRNTLLITGPNMSGKSTYMRQIALIAILAQIGCFVPATEATLPIFDQVFTRIGAADDLISGQSTFMVEMLEAKNAITNATENSLILFDEIGRGTSTYDGMALAQAMIEYIHDHIGAKTLFSTHYHELTILEEKLAHLKNVHVSAMEEHGQVVFLHKIKEGPADKSYGIHVAKLAGLPNELINRANTILNKLEHGDEKTKTEPVIREQSRAHDEQLSFFEVSASNKEEDAHLKKRTQIMDQIKKLDLLDMTPLEAMNKLYEIQKKLKA